MGSPHRLAAVAAVSHARRYYNNTQPEINQTDAPPYSVNVLFISATICGVLVAVCAACWRRVPTIDKPDDVTVCRGVYTVSSDVTFLQPQVHTLVPPLSGPPPAYDSVVVDVSTPKDPPLQEIVTEHCPRCVSGPNGPICQIGRDGGLPSYEAALMLKDTRL